MRIRVIDFETTGMPPDAAVCEVGWSDVFAEASRVAIGEPSSMLVNPRRPMAIEARAVHHISDDDVKNAPPVTTGFRCLTDGYPSAFAAHNAAFEREFFGGGETPWICTFKCARRAWPDFPSYNNQFLRYALDLPVEFSLAMPPPSRRPRHARNRAPAGAPAGRTFLRNADQVDEGADALPARAHDEAQGQALVGSRLRASALVSDRRLRRRHQGRGAQRNEASRQRAIGQ